MTTVVLQIPDVLCQGESMVLMIALLAMLGCVPKLSVGAKKQEIGAKKT